MKLNYLVPAPSKVNDLARKVSTSENAERRAERSLPKKSAMFQRSVIAVSDLLQELAQERPDSGIGGVPYQIVNFPAKFDAAGTK